MTRLFLVAAISFAVFGCDANSPDNGDSLEDLFAANKELTQSVIDRRNSYCITNPTYSKCTWWCESPEADCGDVSNPENEEVSADFQANVSEMTVSFTNESENADYYLWDFGDGSKSGTENPTHTYAAGGEYTVTLTATGSEETDTAAKPVTVSSDDPGDPVPPVASFSFTADELTVTFSNSSQNAASSDWNFGDGNSSSDANPTHTYASAGTYEVTLEVTNADGTDATSSSVTVSEDAPPPPPNDGSIWMAGHSYMRGIEKMPDLGAELGEYRGGEGFLSDWLADADRAVTPARNYEHAGFIEWLQREDQISGSAAAAAEIEDLVGYDIAIMVQWFQTAPACTNHGLVCGPGGQELFNDLYEQMAAQAGVDLIPVGNAFVNAYNAGVTSLHSDGSHPSAQGEYLRNVTIYSYFSGIDARNMPSLGIQSADILRQAAYDALNGGSPQEEPPTASFSASVSNMTASFSNTSQNASSNLWDFGDGTTSSSTNPSHTYSSAGTYTVVLEVSNADGSDSEVQSLTVSSSDPGPVGPDEIPSDRTDLGGSGWNNDIPSVPSGIIVFTGYSNSSQHANAFINQYANTYNNYTFVNCALGSNALENWVSKDLAASCDVGGSNSDVVLTVNMIASQFAMTAAESAASIASNVPQLDAQLKSAFPNAIHAFYGGEPAHWVEPSKCPRICEPIRKLASDWAAAAALSSGSYLGPYIWAGDGIPNAHGVTYDINDFLDPTADGYANQHPSDAGRAKVAAQYDTWFRENGIN